MDWYQFWDQTKAGHKAAVDVELKTQYIKLNQPLNEMNWYRKFELLKRNKLGISSSWSSGTSIGGKPMVWKDVKYCVPKSDELRVLLPDQNNW